VVGLGVGFAADLIELGELHGILGEWTVAGAGDAAEGAFEGDVEPDDFGLAAEEVSIAGLNVGAAAEGEDAVAGEGEGEFAMLDVAEGGFAIVGEDVGDGAAFGGFDTVIEVDEGEVQVLGEAAADGGFAGAHEADEDDH
jgi:hypothetical protein